MQEEGCGWGVKTAEKIPRGEFVIEYVGEGKPLGLVLTKLPQPVDEQHMRHLLTMAL